MSAARLVAARTRAGPVVVTFMPGVARHVHGLVLVVRSGGDRLAAVGISAVGRVQALGLGDEPGVATPRSIPAGRSRPARRGAAVVAAGQVGLAGLVTACSPGGSSADVQPTATEGLQTALVEVHRSPGCGCCERREAYMVTHGFSVESTEEVDLSAFKEARGVPRDAWSCHTAVIDGYTIEGHVPVDAIDDGTITPFGQY